MTTTVVNRHKTDFEVYIGRGSPWGNPFVIGRDGDRNSVCDQYEIYLGGQQELLAKVASLRGKVLGCYCKPARCHGDLLAELADGDRVKVCKGHGYYLDWCVDCVY